MAKDETESIKIRYWSNPLPVVDEIVVATVVTCDNEGAHVTLAEYSDIPAFLPIGEFSRRRRFKPNKLCPTGQQVVLQVTECTTGRDDNPLINVSLRYVTPEERMFNMKTLGSHQKVMCALKKVSALAGIPYSTMVKDLVWPFDKCVYESACDASVDIYAIFKDRERIMELPACDSRDALLAHHRGVFGLQTRALDVEVNAEFLEIDGLEKVKEYLNGFRALSNIPKDTNASDIEDLLYNDPRLVYVGVEVISPPKYKVMIRSQSLELLKRISEGVTPSRSPIS